MKKWIYIFLAACFLCSCQDEEKVAFDATVGQDAFTFTPVPGGAVMHYKLPNDKEVMSIKVRYRNAQGEEMLRSASYACDSVELIGFNEAQQGVEAFVTLCDRANVESEPVRVTFDTKDSGPVSFFDNLSVTAGWHGFDMKYDVPDGACGLVHVFYLGESPFVSGLDTLLLGTYAFNGGSGEMHFDLQQKADSHTVIIRTEDFAGYMVKEKVWENVGAYEVAQLPATEFTFTPSCNVVDDPESKLGVSYLFDGDTKGLVNFPIKNVNEYYTFLAGPDAIGAPFIFEFDEPKQIAEVKLYAMLNLNGRTIPYKGNIMPYSDIWNGQYQNKLPCSFTIYGTNNKDDQSSWVELNAYEELPSTPNENRWSQYCISNDGNTPRLQDAEAVEAADPCVVTLQVRATEEPYRYLILVVNDTYDAKYAWVDQNPDNYVTLHELEVYTKAE